MRRACVLAAWAAMILAISGAAALAAKAPTAAKAKPRAKLNILIVTGQNNHDWRATTPVLKDILERSGRFTVAVTEHPEKCTAADFAPYDAILSNYNNNDGRRWGPTAEKAFLDFIRAGKGFVVIHAADNAFTDWPEYVALIGGIWAGAAGHGARHEFMVRIVDHSHPITRGMSDFMHSTDELYHRLQMQPNLHLLATAYSAPDKGGTGRDEPIAWTVEYQGGRCFHNVLGHDVEAMQDAGFVALVQRGTEWAATGQVSTASDVRMLIPQLGAKDQPARYAAKSGLIGIGAEAVAPLMPVVATGDAATAGEARDVVLWIAQRWAGTPQAPGIEKVVIGFAAASNSAEVRALAARMLGLMGDARATGVLTAMLREPALREEARVALMQIPGPEATQALVAMLRGAPGESGADIALALGARGDKAATPALIAAATSGAVEVRRAAIASLGRLGDGTAAKPLWEISRRGPEGLRSDAVDAYLRLADAALARKQTDGASAMYRQVATGTGARNEMQQVAALTGLGRTRRPDVTPVLAEYVQNGSTVVQLAAAAALAQIPGRAATEALATGIRPDSPVLSFAVMGFLGRRHDPTATPAIVAALSDPDERLRLAAVEAAGANGDPAAAPALRKVIESGPDSLRVAAMKSYLDVADAQLKGRDKAGAAKAYAFAASAAQSGESQARALRGLGAAGGAQALTTVRAALDSPDATVAEAAVDAYMALGDAAAARDKQQAMGIYGEALKYANTPQALAAANKLKALGADINLAAVQGFITNWWIIGPFPNAGGEAWSKVYFPEQETKLDQEYDVAGQKLAWRFCDATDAQGIVALDKLIKPTDNQAAYMYAQVTSPRAQKVKFKVGSDDGIKVWVNGEKVFGNNASRGVLVDNDIFDASLRQGANDILVEILNGSSDWAGVVRITEERDRPLRLEQRKP